MGYFVTDCGSLLSRNWHLRITPAEMDGDSKSNIHPLPARVGGIFAQLYLNVPQVASDQDGSNVGSVLGDTEGGDSEGGSTLNGDRLTGKINIFPLELPSS